MAVEIFKLFGSIFVDSDKAEKSIEETDKKAQSTHSTLGSGIKTAAKWGAAVVSGATAAAGGLISVAQSSASTADNVDKMSQKIGVSREAYQELSFICSQSGTDVDKLQSGMKSLVSAMDGAASGTASNVEQFKKLGVSVTDANGELRNSEDVMWETMSALQNMDNETEKTRLATELFGKSGTELMPLLNGEAGSIEEMKNQAHDLGLVLSDETVDAGVSLTDTMDQMKRSLSAVGTQFGASFMPLVEDVCNGIIDYMPQIQSYIEQLTPIITDFFNQVMPTLMDLGSELLPVIMDLLGQLLPVIGELFSALTPIITQLIEQLLPPILEIVEQLLPPLLSIIQAVLPLIQTIFDLISPFIDVILVLVQTLIESLMPAIEPILVYIAEFLNELLKPLIPVFTEIADIIAQSLAPIFEQLAPIISQLFESFKPVYELLGSLMSALIPALVPVIEWLSGVLSNTLGNAFDFIADLIGNFSGIFSGLIDFITGVFSGDWEQAWNGIVDVFKGIFNLIPTIVEYIINGAIGMINQLLSGINWALDKIGWGQVSLISEVSLPRFRAGIDYVPNDKYLAYLDAGEAVLTAQEAEKYRKNKQDTGSGFVSNTSNEKSVVQNFNVTIANAVINKDIDIDNFAKQISFALAQEVKQKRGELG